MRIGLNSTDFYRMSAGKEIIFEFLRKHVNKSNRTIMTETDSTKSSCTRFIHGVCEHAVSGEDTDVETTSGLNDFVVLVKLVRG